MSDTFANARLDKQRASDNDVRMEARLTRMETDLQHEQMMLKTTEQRLSDNLLGVRSDFTQLRGELRTEIIEVRGELSAIRKAMNAHFLWFMGIQATTTFALLGLGARALRIY